MANTILIKRGTSANLVSLAAGGGLKVGELYFLTDQKILAVGLTTTTYVAYTTDSIPEGTVNKYFTNSRVINSVLTGLSLITNAVVSATDTVLVAIGKLQKQFSDHFGSGDTAHATATVSLAGFMSAADKVKLNGLSGTGAPAGSTGQIQYNSAGAMAGAVNVAVDNNDLLLLTNPSPVIPTAGAVKLYSSTLASRNLLSVLDSSTMDYAVQPSIWRQKIGTWTPPGNGTTLPGVVGFPVPTLIGTATARTVATTNLLTRTIRLGYVSAATVPALSGHFVPAAQHTTGDGAGLGGFFYSCRFAFTDAAAVSGARAFVGMSSSVAVPTNVEPNSLINCIGIAQLSTSSTQLYLVYGGSTAQIAIALGTNFPPMAGVGATNGIVYDLTLYAIPNTNGSVGYRVERVGTTFTAEGLLTAPTAGVQTPSSGTLLAHRAWRCNNATALAVGVDILNVYLETDY